MKKSLFFLVTLVSAFYINFAYADYDESQIAIIEDTDGLMLPENGMCPIPFAQGICLNVAGPAFYKNHPDNYDVLVFFTNKPLNIITNVQMGFPVQHEIRGIGLEEISVYNPQQFGSKGRLLQFVKMSDINLLPDDPKGLVSLPFISGIELMAHEIGHHWMSWIMVDLNDGRGKIPILRGWESGDVNGHWSAWHNTGSVMYGGILTDNNDGTFTDINGPRKYSQLDQYLMGLRTKDEVDEMWFVDVDGTTQGSPSMPAYPGNATTFKGTKVNYTIDDIIRANGKRVPEKSICHLKFAFGIVHPKGMPPNQQQIKKVDDYRQALEIWWPYGTDNRGSIDTNLGGCGTGTKACPGEISPQCNEMPDGDEDSPGICEPGETKCINDKGIIICTPDEVWRELNICPDGWKCEKGNCVSMPVDYTDGDASGELDVSEVIENTEKTELDATTNPAIDGDKTDNIDIENTTPAGNDLCVPGEVKCFGSERKRCAYSGKVWQIIEDCSINGDICEGGACVPYASASSGCNLSENRMSQMILLLLGILLFVKRCREKIIF